jgi:hypothetical protein
MTGFAVALTFNKHCSDPSVYMLISGPDDINRLAQRSVAKLNEEEIEPLREANVK